MAGFFLCLFVTASLLCACSQDDPVKPYGSRAAADSTRQSGLTIHINEEWAGDTIIHF